MARLRITWTMDGDMMTQEQPKKMSQWHVSVAAEAIAAALFARCGLDVSVQYGANQPEYDLAVIRGERIMKVSVKGNSDGGWPLLAGDMEKGRSDYHKAIDMWFARHRPKTIFCFVQFLEVPLTTMPHVYLATPSEVAAHLKTCRGGLGDSTLNQRHVWTIRAKHGGKVDQVPEAWRFSPERVEHLLSTI